MSAFSRQGLPAPRVELAPNIRKTIHSIAFLIREGERRGLPLTQYDIVKSLFLADRTHLNKFGRPVTFDNYYAMRHGPVPSLAYDLLKGNSNAMQAHGIDDLPWRRTTANHRGAGCFVYSDAEFEDDNPFLSPSDRNSLAEALTIISGLTFGQVRSLTHDDIAYKEAWSRAGDLQAVLMSLGLLFDTPNFAAADEIAFISRQAATVELDDDEFAIPPDTGRD